MLQELLGHNDVRTTMIKDNQANAAIIEDWNGVRKLQTFDNRVHFLGGMAVSVGSFVPNAFWNLPFLLSYTVLDETLSVLRDQGEFVCNSRMLGTKMDASKTHLPWQNYDLVFKGKEARNDLAHQALVLKKRECFIYIDAIEAELRAWGVF